MNKHLQTTPASESNRFHRTTDIPTCLIARQCRVEKYDYMEDRMRTILLTGADICIPLKDGRDGVRLSGYPERVASVGLPVGDGDRSMSTWNLGGEAEPCGMTFALDCARVVIGIDSIECLLDDGVLVNIPLGNGTTFKQLTSDPCLMLVEQAPNKGRSDYEYEVYWSLSCAEFENLDV